jgi:hypothetical protein
MAGAAIEPVFPGCKPCCDGMGNRVPVIITQARRLIGRRRPATNPGSSSALTEDTAPSSLAHSARATGSIFRSPAERLPGHRALVHHTIRRGSRIRHTSDFTRYRYQRATGPKSWIDCLLKYPAASHAPSRGRLVEGLAPTGAARLRLPVDDWDRTGFGRVLHAGTTHRGAWRLARGACAFLNFNCIIRDVVRVTRDCAKLGVPLRAGYFRSCSWTGGGAWSGF